MIPAMEEFITGYPVVDLYDPEYRIKRCLDFWRTIPADCRISTMIEILEWYGDLRKPDRTRTASSHIAECPMNVSYALSELTTAAYRLAASKEGNQLKMRPGEAQSLTILRTAFHTCGHGNDTKPPLELALRHFQKKPYSLAFFDAVAVYRECLSHTRQTATQMLRAEIDLILWQDPRNAESPQTACWSEGIRRGVNSLSNGEQILWRALFQSFYCGAACWPPNRWSPRAERTLSALGPDRFGDRVQGWISSTAADPLQLTTAGSYVLKNLIWFAAIIRDSQLDETMHTLLLRRWKRRQPVEKAAVALAYLWSEATAHHGRDTVLQRLTDLAAAYGSGGDQIERVRQNYVQHSAGNNPT